VEDRWARVAPEKVSLLGERAVYIHPGELLNKMHDHRLNLVMLDVRQEVDYNLFHIADARRIEADEILDLIPEFHLEPANTLFIVMSNDEAQATECWKTLVAESVPSVYILEGGLNNWIATFAEDEHRIRPLSTGADEELRYDFAAALGSAFPASDPDPHVFEIEYTPKVKLELKRAPISGGCG
jgi:rhodanese-related sulfurtransferase